ncbi:MFS transporter, DHA1 family, bicyclomycin/chloramphenicol resistance protein [Nocardioides sp. YR527]|uniref:multidrug effflux MFS transporter n=1 Tax=Nocardioides sp. YR527 TaxID=1881028 RepID=UPI000887A19C|nr:multidrug effflux MFS transporter [Nocardioides sp. YR527]SDK56994.1 MFS transporter, DHA1 family, bicyclomycin/chloramphenicol resistance protein [Nocardioides sp. YR527]
MTSPTATIEPPRPAVSAIGPALLLVLALLSAVAPFATDLYLPAFPAMVTDLGTDATSIQLTLTAFLVGVAVGQLAFGPLSDRIGRRTPLLVGAAVFVVSSVAAVFAPTVELLVVARLVQGLSGAAGMVLGRAIVSDRAEGPAAARAMSLMMVAGGVAPVVAPLAGGFIAGPLGWRGVLTVVLAIAVLMLVAVLVVVRESLPPTRRAELRVARAEQGSVVGDLRSRSYVGHTLAFAFGFAVMMAYISASPFLYQEMMGLSEMAYGMLFGLNAFALMIVSAASANLAGRVDVRRMVGLGLTVSLAGTVLFLVIALAGLPVGLLAVAVFVAVAPLGLVLGNATALALESVPRAAGSASAILGALQFGLAALVSPLVSIGGESAAVPAAFVMVTAAVIACTAFVLAGRPTHGCVRSPRS